MERENPFFSIKRVFSLHTSLFPKRTTKGLAALWTLAYKLLLKFLVDCFRTGIDGQEWLWRAFRGYVVTERSRSNGTGIDGQEWLYEHSVCTRLMSLVEVRCVDSTSRITLQTFSDLNNNNHFGILFFQFIAQQN